MPKTPLKVKKRLLEHHHTNTPHPAATVSWTPVNPKLAMRLKHTQVAMPIVRPDDQTASNESSDSDMEKHSSDSGAKNNIQNTYEYMNEKSFDRNQEIFETDPIESGCESDS